MHGAARRRGAAAPIRAIIRALTSDESGRVVTTSRISAAPISTVRVARVQQVHRRVTGARNRVRARNANRGREWATAGTVAPPAWCMTAPKGSITADAIPDPFTVRAV